MNEISVYPSAMERGLERRKRRISEEETIGQTLESKRPRVSVYFRLESESSLDSQDDTESVYSIQDKETDVAHDSSCSESEMGSGSELESGAELVTLEYDVASLSSDGDDFPDYTSSGTEDLNIQAAAEGAFAAVLLDTSMEPWENDGDTSEGSTIFDAFDFEECRRDFWTCLQCKLHNDNPSYRYCEKCFQVRKTFFPPRPKPSRKRKHHEESTDRQRVKLDTLQSCLKELKDNPTSNTQEPGTTNSRIPNLNFEDIVVPQKHLKSTTRDVGSTRTHDVSDSDDIFDEDDRAESPRKKRCKIDTVDETSKNNLIPIEPECSSSQDSGIAVKMSSSQELTDSQASQASISCAESEPEKSTQPLVLNASNLKRHTEEAAAFDREFEQRATRDDMCIMCMTAPKNGIFLHGSIGHMCCCYKCAMRVWRNCKRCPVCNCKVKNVVKLFTS